MIASRARAMTLLGLAFALGLVAGGASLAMAARSGKASWIVRGSGRGSGRGGGYGANLDRRLKLDLEPAERDSITAIACKGMLAMDSLRQQLRPALDSLFQQIRPAIETRRAETRTAIRMRLTPTQRERYDSMNRADDEQRRRIRDQGPPGGGGPCIGSPGGQSPRGGFDRGPR